MRFSWSRKTSFQSGCSHGWWRDQNHIWVFISFCSFTEPTNSPKDVSKIIAELDKGSRASFKGVKHEVFKRAEIKTNKGIDKRQISGTSTWAIFLLTFETFRLPFLPFLMWFNEKCKTKVWFFNPQSPDIYMTYHFKSTKNLHYHSLYLGSVQD